MPSNPSAKPATFIIEFLRRKVDLRYKVEIDRPDKFSNGYIAEMTKLVCEGDQVANNDLPRKIRNAHQLGFMTADGQVVSVLAIKNNQVYRASAERKSGIELSAGTFLGEVGYLSSHKDFRGRGLASCLLQNLLCCCHDVGLFATIRSKNIASRKIFVSNGFFLAGGSWASSDNRDRIYLYIRPSKS